MFYLVSSKGYIRHVSNQVLFLWPYLKWSDHPKPPEILQSSCCLGVRVSYMTSMRSLVHVDFGVNFCLTLVPFLGWSDHPGTPEILVSSCCLGVRVSYVTSIWILGHVTFGVNFSLILVPFSGWSDHLDHLKFW